LQAIKAQDFAPLLGWIVIDMIANRCPEHIVVGFFQTVADVCLGNHEIPPAAENSRLRKAVSDLTLDKLILFWPAASRPRARARVMGS